MFDWLTDLRKSAEEKRDETITAYIDDALPPGEKSTFEAELAQDSDLRGQVEAERQLKLMLSQLPPVRAPRNFGLDPAVYGREKPTIPLFESLYPQLRTATAVAAICLVALFTYSGLTSTAPTASNFALEEAAPVAQVQTTATAPLQTAPVEIEAEAEQSLEQSLIEEAEMAEDAAAASDMEMAEMADEESAMDSASSAELAEDAEMAESAPVSPRTITTDEVRVFGDNQDETMANGAAAEAEGSSARSPVTDEEAVPETEVAMAEAIEEEAEGNTAVQTSNNVTPSTSRGWSGLQITLILLALLTTALLILTIWSRRQIRRYQ